VHYCGRNLERILASCLNFLKRSVPVKQKVSCGRECTRAIIIIKNSLEGYVRALNLTLFVLKCVEKQGRSYEIYVKSEELAI